jgi:hypothetical protein
MTIDAAAAFLNVTSSCREVRCQRRHFLHIDELEAKTICKVHRCRGQCRLAKVRPGETSGFVGWMAEMMG